MNKFLFKSTDADFQKLITLNETIQKNVLYITYRIDLLIKNIDKLGLDANLQKQVDTYFEDTKPEPEEEWIGIIICRSSDTRSR